jgi:hypothetical protein
MYESIALGIKRASPMILDNLGLTIKIGDANETMAEQLGKSVEELTAEEKQMALLNATLEAGDKLIAQVGGTTESATDDIARMETSVLNLKDAIAEGLSPAVSRAAGGIAEFLNTQMDANEVITYAIQLTDEKRLADDKALIAVNNVRDGVWTANEALEWLTYYTKDATEGTDNSRFAMIEAAAAADHEAERLMNAGVWLRDTATATDELTTAQVDLKQQMSDLSLFIQGPLGKEYDTFTQKQSDLTIEIEETQARIIELEGLEYITEEQKSELETAKTKVDELSQKFTDNADAHDEATKRIMFNLLAQRAAIEGLTSEEVTFLQKVATNWGLVDQATADYVTNADAYLGTLAASSGENLGHMRSQLALTLGTTQTNLDGMRGNFGLLDGSMKNSIDVARRLEDQIRRLKGKTITVKTVYKTVGQPYRRQHGGPVKEGNPYIVGEAGPEMFVPFADGEIIPNRRIRGYPNDSYFAPMALTSGERVTVTPKAETRKGIGPGAQVLIFGGLHLHGVENEKDLVEEISRLLA